MLPASFSQSLPGNRKFNPFEVYFILPENEYKKWKTLIKRFNKDVRLTAGIFKFKAYPLALIENSNHSKELLHLLSHSNIMARALNPDFRMIRVEHSFIDFQYIDKESLVREIRLFMLQLCRADLDEVRQELLFGEDFSFRSYGTIRNRQSLKQLEELFSRLSDFYLKDVDQLSLKRLRPLKHKSSKSVNEFRPRSSRRPVEESNTRYLGFQIAPSFPNHVVPKGKEDAVEKFMISPNEDGTFNVNSETLQILMEESGHMVLKKSSLIDEENTELFIKESRDQHNRLKGFPILKITFGNNSMDLALKSKEGSIIYVATLLKHKLGFDLKREEITNIFKNIPKNEVTRENIYSKIDKKFLPAFEWFKDIYSYLFGKNSFDQWFFSFFLEWDRNLRNRLSTMKTYISKNCVEEVNEQINITTTKNSRNAVYSLLIAKENINLSDHLKPLLASTLKYIELVCETKGRSQKIMNEARLGTIKRFTFYAFLNEN